MHYFSDLEGVAPYKRGSRKWHILNTLVSLLESYPFQLATTARLAHQVGVSEAALYKHFPSKDRMFSALVNLTESLLYFRIDKINCHEATALVRCRDVVGIWLFLAEECPGIACILSGSCFQGGSEQLLMQHARLCERFEHQIRRLLKEAVSKEGVRLAGSQAASACLLMSWLEGRVGRFVRSQFALKPSQYWQESWKALMKGIVI